MDADLDALRRELAQVQLASTAHRLSERNCVEIVAKLVQRGAVNLVYTRNGKEFVTQTRLVRELKDELLVQGGRLSLVEAHNALNVDIAHVARAARQVASEDASVQLLETGEGELVSRRYLDSMVDDLADELLEAGRVSLSGVAAKLQLPVDLVRCAVVERLSTTLRGRAELHEGTVYTRAFMGRERARARGAFGALTRPTAVASVAHMTGLDDRMLDTTLAALVKSGELPGSVRGREYVPHLYADVQRTSVESFFEHNGFVTKERASRLGIGASGTSALVSFLRQSFPACIDLDSAVASEGMLHALQAVVDEAALAGSWASARTVLPSDFSDLDVAMMLDKCPQVLQEWAPQQRDIDATARTAEHAAPAVGDGGSTSDPPPAGAAPRCVRVANSYVVAVGMLNALFRHVSIGALRDRQGRKPAPLPSGGAASSAVSRDADATSALDAAADTARGDVDTADDGETSEGFVVVASPAPGRRAAGAASASASTEARPTAGTGVARAEGRGHGATGDSSGDDGDVRAKGKRRAKRGKAKRAPASSAGGEAKPSTTRAGDDASKVGASDVDIMGGILEWCSSLSSIDSIGPSDRPLVDALVATLLPHVTAALAKRSRTALAGAAHGRAGERRKLVQLLDAQLSSATAHACALADGLQALRAAPTSTGADSEADSAAYTLLETHFLSTAATAVTDRLIARECLLREADGDDADSTSEALNGACKRLATAMGDGGSPSAPAAPFGALLSPTERKALLQLLATSTPSASASADRAGDGGGPVRTGRRAAGGAGTSTLGAVGPKLSALAKACGPRGSAELWLAKLDPVLEASDLLETLGSAVLSKKAERRRWLYQRLRWLGTELAKAVQGRVVLTLTLEVLVQRALGVAVELPQSWRHWDYCVTRLQSSGHTSAAQADLLVRFGDSVNVLAANGEDGDASADADESEAAGDASSDAPSGLLLVRQRSAETVSGEVDAVRALAMPDSTKEKN